MRIWHKSLIPVLPREEAELRRAEDAEKMKEFTNICNRLKAQPA